MKEDVLQLINEQDIPLDSLKLQDDLNVKIWNKGNNYKLYPDIRAALLKIATYFESFLDLEDVNMDGIKIIDVIFTGSLANYNWSEYSDIDIHLIADIDEINPDYLSLLESYFKMKKDRFEEKHDIQINGYDVELYVQNKNAQHIAAGTYSILQDEWIDFPEKFNKEIDFAMVERKVRNIMSVIDSLEKNIDFGNIKSYDTILLNLVNIWRKIKKMRQSGLETEGEFALENLVFKMLRRNGYIAKLLSIKNRVIDEKLSHSE